MSLGRGREEGEVGRGCVADLVGVSLRRRKFCNKLDCVGDETLVGVVVGVVEVLVELVAEVMD